MVRSSTPAGSRLSLHGAPGHNLVSRHPDIVKQLSAKIAAWVVTLPKSYLKADEPDK